ncbi:AcrR family transcriptional regulator [Allocatelliglobosispora scoriae]|uniref:AcrR family transcriptional regulator n=1 Tax=Allocatelliglobosispora scoriae TaxID=643052 RepID=A0A841BUZ7_9ACTN|nr:TetR/AcrR family transcriptional regulator [Allocatelliglobosispora scoriae]MBB5870572.1 AcrR family transcriptional regulator [Allocatelliglobosispora scoriae]
MPKVTEEHAANRRRQIVDAARACFVRNGFHQTSMQDIIAEAGLSVGAVYSYFKSKDELIGAIVQDVGEHINANLGSAVGADPAPDLDVALSAALNVMESQLEGLFRLAVQMWGEAIRDPAVGVHVTGVYETVRGHYSALAQRLIADGRLAPGTDPLAVASVLLSMTQGYGLQRVLMTGLTQESYLNGVRAIIATVGNQPNLRG